MADRQIKDQHGIVWTPTCLIRWPSAFTPSLPKGADANKTPQYGVTCILSGAEPDFAEFRTILIEEMDRACIATHGASVADMRQRGKLKLSVMANNDPVAGKLSKPGFMERPNGIHFNATTNYVAPICDDKMMGMSKDRDAEIYDGIFGQAGVTAWGWSHPTGGKGISLNFQGLIKRHDGDKLGGVQADMSGVASDGYVPEGAKQAPAAPDPQSDPNQQQPQQQSGDPAGTVTSGSAGGFGF